MSEIASLLTGVISGVITAALLYLVGLGFRKQFMPWYRDVTYQGLDVSGPWVAVGDTQGIKGRFELVLEQKAHELSGTLNLSQGKDLANPHTVAYLKVTGSVWEGFVTINLKSRDRTRLSYATCLLRSINGGIRLEGTYLYRSIQTDEIRSIDLKFERAKNG